MDLSGEFRRLTRRDFTESEKQFLKILENELVS